jgi:hypothetical protein
LDGPGSYAELTRDVLHLQIAVVAQGDYHAVVGR